MTAPATLLVGLQAEAKIVRTLGWPVLIGGGSASGAEAAARRHAGTPMISIGLAGGLDPSLSPGTVIVPSAIVLEGRALPTDPGLNERLGGSTRHLLLGAADVAGTVTAKRALWQATGAAAVDLESGAVARYASRFAALRVICDPADRDLPPAALIAIRRGGAIGLLRVLASLVGHPTQLPALMRLASDAAAARQALTEAIGRITP